MPLLNRVLRYGLVGGTAAAVHISVLLLLGPWMSLSLANPIAFLAVINLSVCALLPLLQAPTLVLVFTPTLLNVVIWSRAARFSAKARQKEWTSAQQL